MTDDPWVSFIVQRYPLDNGVSGMFFNTSFRLLCFTFKWNFKQYCA